MKTYLILLLFVISSVAQDNFYGDKNVYRVSQSTELAISSVLFATGLLGVYYVSNKPNLSLDKVNALKISDIPAFDRSAVRQSFPAPKNVYDYTDIGLYGASAIVPLLLLDDNIREDWYDIAILFFETQSINLNFYYWGGPAFTRRIRPIVYYKGTSLQIKTGDDMTDAFFSGHVSMTAGATFFMAKIYNDYHPELGWKGLLLYAAAIIPPALVGYGRYRGLMHFPSDILTGLTVGAATGILVPHLHKIIIKGKTKLSFLPLMGEYKGIRLAMHF